MDNEKRFVIVFNKSHGWVVFDTMSNGIAFMPKSDDRVSALQYAQVKADELNAEKA